MKYFFGFSFILFFGSLWGQIVITDPIFPKATDEVTITFDASQGSGGLAGLPPGTPVFLHTGLITQNGGPGNWQYVVGNWGTFDPRVLMTRVGSTDKYTFTFDPDILTWYEFNNNAGDPIPGGTVVRELAFVFRNQDGSREGKTLSGSDIFVPIYGQTSDLLAKIVQPGNDPLVAIGDTIPFFGATSKDATLQLYDNGNLIAQTVNDSLVYELIVTEDGNHDVLFEAIAGADTVRETFRYVVLPDVNPMARPGGTIHGINYTSDTSAVLVFYAPFFENVFVIGDFNDWKPDADYLMHREADDATYWLELSGLEAGKTYKFQYLVDAQLKVTDPYSELILDPFHDQFIDENVFPELPAYPEGKTQGQVSLLQPGKAPYPWKVTDFQKPAREDLVIYELLVRDFIDDHSYQTILDTLDYLARLGINAIEFMPVMEFDGNSSWGYEPTHHMALDKYYGRPEDFKALIDACHERGIAVILDIVPNQATGLSPLAQLYWDASSSKPLPQNPWLNVNPTHSFSVFNDFNHESQATKRYFHRVFSYWIQEYKVDGYRIDLARGLTQNKNGGFDAYFYDPSRIAIIKEYADSIWRVDPESRIILEYFIDPREEKEMAEYGMMVWSNLNHQYNQATMGYDDSNFSDVSYKSRGWTVPHLLGNMESHDEERLMYKNLAFGNSSGNYNIMDLNTALKRMELAANFNLTVPGPKMLWQFVEFGYDITKWRCPDGTIREGDDGCKLSPKPTRWEYLDNPNRQRLFNVFRELIQLRKTYPVFQTDDFTVDVDQDAWKRIHLNHTDMDAAIIGNFSVTQRSINPAFQHTGWWYEYYSGDSILVNNVNESLAFEPGEYRLYTDKNIGRADILVGVEELPRQFGYLVVYPNPTAGPLTVELSLKKSGLATFELFSSTGRSTGKVQEFLPAGESVLHLDLSAFDPVPGVYFLSTLLDGAQVWKKVIIY